MDIKNLSQKKIIKNGIYIALSDWENAGQPIEELQKTIMNIIDNNFNVCEKCNQTIPSNEEYFECVLQNSPHPIKNKVCFKCFKTYILNTAG